MIAEQFAILLNHNIVATKIRDLFRTLLAVAEVVDVVQIEFPDATLVGVAWLRLAGLLLVARPKISGLRNLYSILALQFILS